MRQRQGASGFHYREGLSSKIHAERLGKGVVTLRCMLSHLVHQWLTCADVETLPPFRRVAQSHAVTKVCFSDILRLSPPR
jgi:hypothetical protein